MNRQNHVMKLMRYEEYEVWPVLVDMVREKAMFGNPIEARKFCKKLRKSGAMLTWIKENGGNDYMEPPPKYRRIPTEEEIINEIYSKARARSDRMTKQKEDLEHVRVLMQKELGFNDEEKKEAIKTVDEDSVSVASGATEKGGKSRSNRKTRGRRRSTSSTGKESDDSSAGSAMSRRRSTRRTSTLK